MTNANTMLSCESSGVFSIEQTGICAGQSGWANLDLANELKALCLTAIDFDFPALVINTMGAIGCL